MDEKETLESIIFGDNAKIIERYFTVIDRKLWAELPTGISPRDGKTVGKTNDLLFEFRLLTHRERGCRRLSVFREEKSLLYLVQDASGTFLHPVTGIPVKPSGEWTPCGTINMSIIQKHIKTFWDFRAMGKGYSTGHSDYTLCVEGLRLSKKGKMDQMAISAAEKRWPGWALDGGDDLLIDHINELKYFNVSAWEAASLGNDIVLCPLDGPVRFILGDFISSDKSWRDMCGRHYKYALCPKCLGTFAAKLFVMN
jgi:hypothetical protein